MAQQVTKWKAEDGSLHDTEQAADRHTEKARLRQQITDEVNFLVRNGDCLDDEWEEALTTGDLGNAVYQYHAFLKAN